MTKIEFFLPLKKIPTVTAQQKKVRIIRGKPQFYETDELKNTRELYMNLLRPYKPPEPLDGPLRLTTKWLYPMKEKVHNGDYKYTKPDTDNTIKLFKDCMEKTGYFVNDSRVASELIEKFWAETIGIYVKLETINDR